ncbi:ADP-ribosylglycohydrolase family protein [Microscilla marina]|uniref:ADP-ribosylhydrolase like 2 n=1 Tax=Microscilla marina ATCC 23134 TaxID=313606 RepID=A1ZNF4_MICM2|nr:ADP-ribosylglycohydrolase family protein [Microscilla marina]EAY28065.1 ADP-ribosylhydrolase like 2 [Microscilla marina ATCC 23134]
MLIELAIGDAYGAGFEYVDRQEVVRHNNLSYRQHPKHTGTLPGMYTDDTQMSLAIAELMLSGDAWTPLNIAHRFVEVFKRDPREGYAEGFYHFLRKNTGGGEEFLAHINPTSDKSGAAMRAPVIGLLADKQEVLEKAEIQAAITHCTKDGINAAQASALIVHFFAWEGGKKQDLAPYLKANVKGDWLSRWTGKVRSKGWMSVRAAITAIAQADTMSNLLKNCIAYTGDVDTVAAIALAGASMCKEIKQDLPYWLYGDMENGTYGKAYIETLDAQLKEKYFSN